MKLFTKDHEWILIDGDVATVGITDHAQGQLGDVVFVELPDLGKVLVKGGEAAVVESVKAASEVYAPLDGTVIEVNGGLVDDPALVNSAAESDGWFLKIKLAGAVDTSDLLDADAYAALIG